MKATNNQIQEDKKRFLRLLNKAGFKNIKAFSDSEEIDLKYSAISKWGTEKDKAENLRPFPKWVFSWLNLYIENKKNRSVENDIELVRENAQLKEKIYNISKIIRN